MISKTVNHKTGAKTYICYTKEEADELGIKYKPWKEVFEPGEYGLTDDDIVLPLIKRKEYQGNSGAHNSFITYPLGSMFFYSKSPDRKFNIRGTYDTGSLGRDERRIKSSKGEQMARFFAIVPDKDIVIDSVLGPHSETTHGKWSRYFKTEVFKKMVREELRTLLRDKGFDEAATLDLLKETIELCKNKRDASTLMRAVTELLDINGMKSKDKIKTTDTIEGSASKKMIDDINREERKIIKITRVTEGEDNERVGATERPRTEEDRT